MNSRVARAKIAKVAARLRGRAVAGAFDTWAVYTAECRRNAGILQRVVGQFAHRSTAAAWGSWAAYAVNSRVARAKIAKVAARMLQSVLASAFAAWATHWKRARQLQRLMRGWRNTELKRAVARWAGSARALRQARNEAAVQGELQEMRQRWSSASTASTTLEAEMQKLRERWDEATAASTTLSEDLEQCRAEVSRLSAALLAERARTDSLVEREDQLTAELMAAQVELSAVMQHAKEAVRVSKVLHAECYELNRANTELEATLRVSSRGNTRTNSRAGGS